MKPTYWLAAVAVTWTLAGASVANANDAPMNLNNLSQEIDKVAAMLVEKCRDLSVESVTLGAFSGPPDGNFGPGLRERLRESLERVQPGFLRKRAPHIISADYAVIDDPALAKLRSTQPNVKMRKIVKLQLTTKRDDLTALDSVDVTLSGNLDVAQASGATVALPENGSFQTRAEELSRRIDAERRGESTNSPFIDSAGRLRSSAKGEVAIGIRAKRVDDSGEYRPRPIRLIDGCPFVDLQPGDVYEVVLSNQSRREIAVFVTIDGLSTFAFSEMRDPKTKRPSYSFYALDPGTETVVMGWHRRDKAPNNFDSFLVKNFGEGVSKHGVEPVANVGLIQAAVAFVAPQAKGGSETGFGPPRSQEVKAVSISVDPPHEFLSIRYDR